MPRYYFHIREDRRVIEDHEGAECPDAKSAVDEAVLAAREMVSDMLACGMTVDGEELLICDEYGRQIANVPIKSAFLLN
jgi:hypothetical protein